MTDPLKPLLEAAAAAPGGVVLLDLDSTLIDTAPRHLAILRAWVAAEAPALASVAYGLQPSDFGWSVEAPLEARGLLDPSSRRALLAFWHDRFFDGAWHVHDAAAPGAVAAVQRLVQAGLTCWYLTGRVRGAQAEGTVRSLLSLGFPLFDGRTVLEMKPDAQVSDAAFKAATLARLREEGRRVVGAFENEPGHANKMKACFPDALVALVGDVHSPEAPPADPAVARWAGWTVQR